MRWSGVIVALLGVCRPVLAQDTARAKPGDTVTVRYVIPATAMPGDWFRVAVLGPNDYSRLFVIGYIAVDGATAPPSRLPPPPSLPPPSLPSPALHASPGTAPTYDSTSDVLLVTDDFDSWSGLDRRGVPRPTLRVYRDSALGGGRPPATAALVPGRGGHGQAVRITYPRQVGNAQGRHYVGTEGVSTPPGVSSFQEVWIRTSAGASPDGFSPKWIQHYHPAVPGVPATRIQISSFRFEPGSRALRGLPARDYWHVNSMANSLALSRSGPSWRNVNDGEWHRFTTEVRAHTRQSARDGVARLWIDGILAVDLSAAGVAAGRASERDLAGLAYGVPITDIHLGDVLFLGRVATWTMDVDDFRRWQPRRNP